MRDGTVPLDSVISLHATSPPDPLDRGKGFKPFHRWLNFMSPRVDANGLRPSNGVILRALERAEEDRLEEAAQRSMEDASWELSLIHI